MPNPPKPNLITTILILFIILFKICDCEEIVDPKKSIIYGFNPIPALPVRYFFIEAYNQNGERLQSNPPLEYQFNIKGKSPFGDNCRFAHEFIHRGDGSTIVRYKIAEYCENVEFNIKYNGTHIAKSPYIFRNKIYSEKCYCPSEINDWIQDMNCPRVEKQILQDLQPFKKINFTLIRESLLKKYTVNLSGTSLCHYVIINQKVYRNCFGKYIGFRMFMDATLASLLRIVKLPDTEFYLNLGDWPLVKKGGQQRTTGPYPIFSWCGSNDSFDIVLPTYNLMESSREAMGRVSLDLLSVQREKYSWNEKENKAFWRGRDSRRQRLDLIGLAKKNPDLINASITNFFFFRDLEDEYGPTVPHISFLDFFKYKYQITIDGTVAAYRLPYLLAGGSLVIKQNSPFYEHFYSKLIPNKHYIPVERDLSDLIEKIKWSQQNDEHIKEITKSARQFAEENLLPKSIYCYHMILLQEYSQRIINSITIHHGMEQLEQDYKCNCLTDKNKKDEL